MQRLYKGIALCLGLCLLFFALGGCEKEDVGYNDTAHSDVISQEPDSQADATSSEREGADDTSDMTHSDVISQETDSQTDATPSEREGTNNTSNMTRSDVISQEPDSQTDAMPSEREGTNDTSDIICSDAIGQETDNQTGTTPFQAHVIDRGVHAETNVAPFIMQSVQDVEDYHTRLETEYGFSDLKTQLNEIGIGYDNDYFEKKH